MRGDDGKGTYMCSTKRAKMTQKFTAYLVMLFSALGSFKSWTLRVRRTYSVLTCLLSKAQSCSVSVVLGST